MIVLDGDGFLENPSKKVDKIFDYYFTTSSLQTNVFKEENVSFHNTVRLYESNPNDLSDMVQQDLENIFSGYFHTVNLEVFPTNVTNEQFYTLNVTGTVTNQSGSVAVAKEININIETKNS